MFRDNLGSEVDFSVRPFVSVVLPVHNGSSTISRAIESIFCQTFEDFELIVINDGSTDGTQALLHSFRDARKRILEQENRGLVPSLNRGILHAKGKYIARMDADDVALPSRLEKQVKFLEENPRVAAVGSAAVVIYPDGSKRMRRRPPDTQNILKNIVRICPFFHSSVMIRKTVFGKVGLYDVSKDGSKKQMVEDYDLWVRMLEAQCELANLPEVLMLYYKGSQSILGRRPFGNRLKQQIFSRVDIIRRLQLGPCAYLNMIPIVFLSAFSCTGFKLDRVFNFLSSSRETF